MVCTTKFRVIFAILFGAQWLAIAGAQSIVLVGSGTSEYSIAIPNNAVTSDQWAAKELQCYITKMTGITISIENRTEANGKPTIWIDPPQDVTQSISLLKNKSFENEEFLIIVSGKDLIIAGGQPRGVIYGVYELLENVWGCHWFTPDCEVVPKYNKLILPVEFERAGKPSLEYRDVLFQEGFDPIWATRNRAPGAAYQIGRSMDDKGGRRGIWPIAHGMEEIMPYEKYFPAHPDLFAKRLTGEINIDSSCYSSEELYQLTKEKVREWMKTHSDAEVYDISQKDGGLDGCHCKNCQALIDAQGSQIAPILTMANRLANDMKDELNGKYITFLAYSYSSKPPKTLRADPKVVVRLCNAPITFGKPVEASFDDVREWRKHTDRLWLWVQIGEWKEYFIPIPNVKTYAEHIEYLSQIGVNGMMHMGNYREGGGDMTAMKAWVWAKVMWDSSANIDSLIETFSKGYYGKAAKPMLDYVYLMDSAARRLACDDSQQGDLSHWNSKYRHYLDPDTIAQAWKLLNNADKLADDPNIKTRIALTKLSTGYARWINAMPMEASVRDGKYGFFASEQAVEEMDEWFSDVKRLGYVSISQERKLGPYETKMRKMIKDKYDTVVLKNSKTEVVVVPEKGGRIVSLRPISNKTNLVNMGSYNTEMRYENHPSYICGIGEAIGLQPTEEIGYEAAYNVIEKNDNKVVLVAELLNGEKITKTIELSEDAPSVHVGLNVEKMTSASDFEQRLHIRLSPSIDSAADRQIWYQGEPNSMLIKYDDVREGEVSLLENEALVRLASGWIINRSDDTLLMVQPDSGQRAIDIDLVCSNKTIKFMRIGFGGWLLHDKGQSFKMGYSLICKNKSEIK